jgi:hypothetical protein
MASTTDYTDIKAYQDFVEDFSSEIFTQLYYGFETMARATVHEGVKGKKTWTVMDLKRLLKAYFSTMAPEQTNSLHPVTIETHTFKLEHSEVPQDLRETWLGFTRKPGFNHQEWPFERYTLNKFMEKTPQEMEDAVWQAITKGTAIVPGDNLDVMFDGFLKIITDAITATTIVPVATPAWTIDTVLPNLELMYADLPIALKKKGTDIHLPVWIFDLYMSAMEEKFKGNSAAYTEIGEQGYMIAYYRQGGKRTKMYPTAGMGTSSRVLFLPSEHLHIAIDSESDFKNFVFQQHFRELFFWLDGAIGVQMTLLKDGFAVVNDLP